MQHLLSVLMALHPNFDTRDDCSKRVQLAGANQVQRMRLLPMKLLGENRRMHPHRVRRVHGHQVQLLQAEVDVHPHRVQMHPVLVHFGRLRWNVVGYTSSMWHSSISLLRALSDQLIIYAAEFYYQKYYYLDAASLFL